jgi:uncharacterized membrane protein
MMIFSFVTPQFAMIPSTRAFTLSTISRRQEMGCKAIDTDPTRSTQVTQRPAMKLKLETQLFMQSNMCVSGRGGRAY